MLNRTEGEPKAKAWLRRAAVWLLWIALWQAIAAMVRNPIIFVGPFEMLRALWDQLFDAVFWQTIGHSFGKISLGFLGAFATGFHFAFGIAIFAMLISLVIYLANKRKLPDPRKLTASGATSDPHTVRMAAAEVKKRIWALIAVYAVVIFFWFSFHQNGLTLTFFAKDYTLLKIGSLDLSAEIFQSMNPFFVVFLTPAVLAFFGWMRANGREPSTPAKIAIGMGIAATAYLVMMLGSLNLPSAAEVEAMGGLPDSESVTPFLLIGTYLILTIAELFISPLGISFVSKVAPPQYQGLMQGGWLGATAIGNQLLFIGAVLYQTIPIWLTWGMFVVVCLISMIVMFSMLKWLNRITKQ